MCIIGASLLYTDSDGCEVFWGARLFPKIPIKSSLSFSVGKKEACPYWVAGTGLCAGGMSIEVNRTR